MKKIALLLLVFAYILNNYISYGQKIEWEVKNHGPTYFGLSLLKIINNPIDKTYFIAGNQSKPGVEPNLGYDTLRTVLFKVNQEGVLIGINTLYRKGMWESFSDMEMANNNTLRLLTFHTKYVYMTNKSALKFNLYLLDSNRNIIYDHFDSTNLPLVNKFMKLEDKFIGFGITDYSRFYEIYDNEPDFVERVFIDTLDESEYIGYSSGNSIKTENDDFIYVTRVDSLDTKYTTYVKVSKFDKNLNILWENYLTDELNVNPEIIYENSKSEIIIGGSKFEKPRKQLLWQFDENGNVKRKVILRDWLDFERLMKIKELSNGNYVLVDKRVENDSICMNISFLDNNLDLISDFKFNCEQFSEQHSIHDFIEVEDGSIIVCGKYLNNPYYAKIVDILTTIEDERSTTTFRLGPNPALNQLYANFDIDRIPIRWQVINSIGIIQYEAAISSSQLSLEISAYHAGLYFAMFEYADGTRQVEKFIKIGE